MGLKSKQQIINSCLMEKFEEVGQGQYTVLNLDACTSNRTKKHKDFFIKEQKKIFYILRIKINITNWFLLCVSLR